MIILLLLLVQTLWLLPALDARIPLYQQGLEVLPLLYIFITWWQK